MERNEVRGLFSNDVIRRKYHIQPLRTLHSSSNFQEELGTPGKRGAARRTDRSIGNGRSLGSKTENLGLKSRLRALPVIILLLLITFKGHNRT